MYKTEKSSVWIAVLDLKSIFSLVLFRFYELGRKRPSKKSQTFFFLNLLFLHLSKRLIGNLYVSIYLLSGMTMDSHQGRGAGKAPNHHHHHRIDFLLLDTFAWSFTFKATCFTSSKVNFPSPLTSNSSIMALTCVKERFRWANFNSPRETYLQIKPDLISKNN